MTVIAYQKNPFIDVYDDIVERKIEGRFVSIKVDILEKNFPYPINFRINSLILCGREIIGAGTYSKVIEAYLPDKNKIVALKISNGDQLLDNSIIREAKIINIIFERCFNAVNHIGLLYHFGPYTTPRKSKKPFLPVSPVDNNEEVRGYGLVLERLGPNLKKLIKINLGFKEVQLIAKDIAKALLVLKRAQVIHADLKLENIVTTESSYVKIIDFGLSRLSSGVFSKENKTIPMQTEYYRSPEVWLIGKKHIFEVTPAIDMWSFGCILAELKTGQVLFKNLTEIFLTLEEPQNIAYKQLYDRMLSLSGGLRLSSLKEKIFGKTELNNDVDKYFLDLLEKIFVYDSNARITPEEVLKHPFIKEIFFV